MDETDILEYHCQICYQSYTSLWALNRHVKREHTTPKDTSITGEIVTGLLIAFAPGAVIGFIVAWLAWDIKPHNAAVIAGMIIFLVVMWMGAWLAGVVVNAPAPDPYPTASVSQDTAPEPADGRKNDENGGVGA